MPYLLDIHTYPVGGVEDLLFGFSIGGIGAFAYESLFVRGICKCEEKKLKREWFLFVFFAVMGGSIIILNNFLGQELFPSAHAWMLRIWKLSGTAKGVIVFKHIPWTEMLWGFSWGLVWGPMYEFLVGARTITFSKNKMAL